MYYDQKTSLTTKRITAFMGVLILCICMLLTGCRDSKKNAISFEGRSDVGEIELPGSFDYDPRTGQYRMTGSGENIWFQSDAFYYAWNRLSGDLELQSELSWVGEGQHEHRKAGLMVRQSLEPDAAYVDVVIHGDGLTSMQYRSAAGGQTNEITSPVKAPAAIKLLRDGNLFSFYVSKDAINFIPVGSMSLELTDPVYTGLIVCSHDKTTSETAVFKNVSMKNKVVTKEEERMLQSNLEIIDIETGIRKIIYTSNDHFEAPNWSRDGKTLLFNSGGKLYTIPVSGGTPTLLNTDFADRCNNDHGYSPDGNQIVISHHDNDVSKIYILPATGGTPRLVTEKGPSYWHGWSPDGKTLAYCAERNGKFDIYTIAAEGGQEKRLTDAEGLDDGPEYSRDGRYIYFNSDRTGIMRIWRMDADGKDQVQITSNEDYGDWFPHQSYDGKWIVFLSYDKSVEGHPANKDVALRIMATEDQQPKILTTLFGGQGTINVHSWSPDSRKIAFVSYRLVGP